MIESNATLVPELSLYDVWSRRQRNFYWVPPPILPDPNAGGGVSRIADVVSTVNTGLPLLQNMTGSMTMMIDGVPIAVGDIVLLTGQFNPAENGLWIVGTPGPDRPVSCVTPLGPSFALSRETRERSCHHLRSSSRLAHNTPTQNGFAQNGILVSVFSSIDGVSPLLAYRQLRKPCPLSTSR